jgi:hypothetical protein
VPSQSRRPGKVKELIVTEGYTDLDAGLVIEEAIAVGDAATWPDALEGIMAFAERRHPNFG